MVLILEPSIPKGGLGVESSQLNKAAPSLCHSVTFGHPSAQVACSLHPIMTEEPISGPLTVKVNQKGLLTGGCVRLTGLMKALNKSDKSPT